MPKHDWQRHEPPDGATITVRWNWGNQRRCRLCGAVQKREMAGYDRIMTRTYYLWHPPAGRCPGKKRGR